MHAEDSGLTLMQFIQKFSVYDWAMKIVEITKGVKLTNIFLKIVIVNKENHLSINVHK